MNINKMIKDRKREIVQVNDMLLQMESMDMPSHIIKSHKNIIKMLENSLPNLLEIKKSLELEKKKCI